VALVLIGEEQAAPSDGSRWQRAMQPLQRAAIRRCSGA
jgi:hypothetical protein